MPIATNKFPERFGTGNAKDVISAIHEIHQWFDLERYIESLKTDKQIEKIVDTAIKEIIIKDGVGISNQKKKGLFRTVDVAITLQENNPLEANSKQKMELFLKETLEKQSVMNIPYQITIN